MRRELGLHGAEVVGGDGVALLRAQQVVEHPPAQQHWVGGGGGRGGSCSRGCACAAGAYALRTQQLHGTARNAYWVTSDGREREEVRRRREPESL